MPPSRSSGSPAGMLQQTKDVLASITFDVLLGKVAGFTTALVGVYLSARKIQEALRESAGAEALKNQLIALGVSAAAAEAKIASLSKMAANGAVSFESLGNAAKILRVIGGAAADTEGNLRQISDVFAASGAPVAAVATAYAQFYQAIKQGGDVSSAAQDMANLGGISQDAAAKIRDLSAAGASSAQILRSMQTAMDSTKGASEALKDSVAGLSAKLRNLQKENNVKLGEKFLEGEKAGYRTAIAFEKLKNILQSGIADTIAPIKNAWAQLIEQVVKSEVATVSVKGLTAAIQGLMLLAAGFTLKAIGDGLKFLIGLFIPAATGISRMSGILGILGSGLARVSGIILSAGAAWTVFGAALTAAGVSAYNSYQNIKKLNEEAAKKQAQRSAQVDTNRKDASLITTKDEQQKKIEAIDEQIAAAQKEKEKNQDKRKLALETYLGKENAQTLLALEQQGASDDEKQRFLAGVSVDKKYLPWKTKEAEESALVATREDVRLGNQINILKNQRADLLNQSGLGVGKEENERLKNQALLERNIRNESVQQLQSQLNPQGALDVANRELQRIKDEKTSALKDAPKIENERQKIDAAAKKVVEAGKSGTAEEFQKALEELQNTEATTKASQLHRDAVYRTTLREESANQQDILNQNPLGPMTAAQKQALGKMSFLQSAIGVDFHGDTSQINPETTQGIERDRDIAMKAQDPADLTRREQSQKNVVADLEKQVAATNAVLEKERERVAIEEQLASISDSSANAEYKAGATANQRIAQLQKAKAAAEELEKKTAEYQASLGTPEESKKKEQLLQARSAAELAGTEGLHSSEIGQKLDAENRVLQVRMTAARIAENAARAEYQAAQRRLALERQMVELRANQAEQIMGKGFNNSEIARLEKLQSEKFDGLDGNYDASIARKDQEIAQKQKALDAAKARDVADTAAKANPTQENNKAAQEARKRAADLGVTDSTPASQLESQLKELKQQRAALIVNQQSRDDGEIKQRIQELKKQQKGESERIADAQDLEISEKQRALYAAKVRDDADAAAKANATDANVKAAQEARERAAALGVTDSTNTRDIENQLEELKQQRAQTAVSQATQNNRSSQEMQIQGARIQEQYAPNSLASRSAKLLADSLEDQLAKADKVKELTSAGMTGANAERVADIEVQRSRILSNIEKEGRPEASSMARIGGSSGWAGLVGGATQDKQARLEELNQQMVQLLKVLASDSSQSMSLYRTLLNNNK